MKCISFSVCEQENKIDVKKFIAKSEKGDCKKIGTID